jgi:hypothetical protein
MGWVVSITPRPRFTSGETTPGTHCTGGWVGPRAGLDTEARGKILCPRRGSNPDRPVVQPVVRHYTAWATRLQTYQVEKELSNQQPNQYWDKNIRMIWGCSRWYGVDGGLLGCCCIYSLCCIGWEYCLQLQYSRLRQCAKEPRCNGSEDHHVRIDFTHHCEPRLQYLDIQVSDGLMSYE